MDVGTTFSVSLWVWGSFVAIIVALLIVDLKVVMGAEERFTTREAAIYSGVWITLGLAFSAVLWWWQGNAAAVEYLTGYAIEKSLSIDNVFLWSVIFNYFAVPHEYRHRVLFWGVFGALVFRAAFIFAGVAALESIAWLSYVFGVFLILTGARVALREDAEVHPDHNPVLRGFRRIMPVTEGYQGHDFFVRHKGKLMATPLAAVLVVVETTDVVFAVDSIPAILAVTRNEFIVFSSNAFAILGLRALYFLLAGMHDKFVYLNRGLGVILGFVGVKFIVDNFVHIPTLASLAVIVVVLAVTIWLSVRAAPDGRRPADPADR